MPGPLLRVENLLGPHRSGEPTVSFLKETDITQIMVTQIHMQLQMAINVIKRKDVEL